MQKKSKILIILLVIAVLLILNVLYQVKIKGINNNWLLLGIVAATTILAISLCISINKEKNFDIDKSFKMILPIVGLLFIMAMPIFRSHDEDVHWLRIYDIAQGNVFTSTEYGHIFRKNSKNYPAAKLPKAVSIILDKSYSRSKTKEIFDVKIDENDVVYFDMARTAVYSPVQYLPQAIRS